MVFSSYMFLFVFLPAVLILYYGVGRALRGWPRAAHLMRTVLLIVASYVFYGWERYLYVVLILFSTVVDLLCGGLLGVLERPLLRRACLLASIVTNLSLLGFFKYRNFVIESLGPVMSGLGAEPMEPLLPALLLPVGISFYTFQSMSYTIDVYRRAVPPVSLRRSLDFVAYVALFPQLVAGPIVRFRDLKEQLEHRIHSLDKFSRGVFVFMLGFAKKTLIANHASMLADALFKLDHPGFADAWAGMLGYTFQIYFDFSGYSDMAIGLGLMIGFVFPKNFDSPYKSQSITEFWRRWHISLSSWLRDYLYVPLGGNRRGEGKTYRNLLITMLLGGLWHGAAWTFLIWGAWHGALLALERRLGKVAAYGSLPAPGRVALTFFLVVLGWVLFRADSLPQALDVYAGLLGGGDTTGLTLRPWRSNLLPLAAIGIGAALAFFGRTTLELSERITWAKALGAYVVFFLGVQQMLQSKFNPFIYFKF